MVARNQVLASVLGLVLAAALVQVDEEQEDVVALYKRCKAPLRPAEYGVISSMPPQVIRNCKEIMLTDLLADNKEIMDITTQKVGKSAEVLLLAERFGPIHMLNIVPQGDTAHWDVFRPPARQIGKHSCQDRDFFCEAISVTSMASGFVVADRHRVSYFNFSWEAGAVEELLAQSGHFNIVPVNRTMVDMLWPTASALYKAYNETHLSPTYRIYPNVPDARRELLFVTDTGNHRVVIFDTSARGQMDYVGQFGITGENRSDDTGLHWPYGIAVTTPAVETSFRPVFANVFVADRQNNRLVKLNLGYELRYGREELALMYSCEYGKMVGSVRHNETLREPTDLILYRHYIIVAEAVGNALSVLTVHPSDFNKLVFVTKVYPAKGNQLMGQFSISPLGHVWYTYIKKPSQYAFGSFFLEEALRESTPGGPMDEIVAKCVNDTWYHLHLRFNEDLYFQHMGYLLNATRQNWVYPDYPDYVDITRFNLSFRFDLDALNATVFMGRMHLCVPPPPSTTPPMLSGNADGWVGGDGRNFPGGSPRLQPSVIARPWVLGVLIAATASPI